MKNVTVGSRTAPLKNKGIRVMSKEYSETPNNLRLYDRVARLERFLGIHEPAPEPKPKPESMTTVSAWVAYDNGGTTIRPYQFPGCPDLHRIISETFNDPKFNDGKGEVMAVRVYNNQHTFEYTKSKTLFIWSTKLGRIAGNATRTYFGVQLNVWAGNLTKLFTSRMLNNAVKRYAEAQATAEFKVDDFIVYSNEIYRVAGVHRYTLDVQSCLGVTLGIGISTAQPATMAQVNDRFTCTIHAETGEFKFRLYRDGDTVLIRIRTKSKDTLLLQSSYNIGSKSSAHRVVYNHFFNDYIMMPLDWAEALYSPIELPYPEAW